LSGRGFFAGGISPDSTWSNIFSQVRKTWESDKSKDSSSKFSGVFVDPSWHSIQESSMSGEIVPSPNPQETIGWWTMTHREIMIKILIAVHSNLALLP
jgi:hypothetical protein